jgi:putative transposase
MVGWLTISELAKFSNESYDTLKKAAQRGRYRLVKDSESSVALVSINDPAITSDTRRAYLCSQAPAADGVKAQVLPSLKPSVANISAGKGDPPLPSHSFPGMVPDKLKNIALARVDLVTALEAHRKVSGTSRNLLKADDIFERSYNTGLLLPAVYKVLGKVDIKSIYKWKKVLKASSNWRLVVPGWDCEKREPSLTTEEKKVIQDCLLHPNRLSIGEATKIAKVVLVKRGICSPSSSRKFRRWAEWYKGKNSALWTLMREGQKALRDKEIFSIKRDISKLEVGDVFIADGHRLNFQVINPFTGKPCRATLIGYLDWKSFDLAGFDIMIEENTQVIASALRNGIIRLGKIPKIAYQDNGKAFRAKFFTDSVDFEEAGYYGLFGRLGIKPVFAMPYNARAKLIERFFKEFAKFERLLPSFTGTSIEDKPAYLKRNETFHAAHHNNYIPTIEETVGMVDAWIREYLEIQPCPHQRGRTIGEVFREGQGPGVNVSELDELMLAQEIKTIRANGIRFLGADYFDEGLCGLREKVMIKYSLSDLSSVKVYDCEGTFIGTANRAMPVHPMAYHLGTVKDVTEYKHLQARKKQLEKITMNAAKELIAQGAETPPWLDMLPLSPKMIDTLEETAASSRRTDESLSYETTCSVEPISEKPEEPRKGIEGTQDLTESSNQETVISRPNFGTNAIARYEWHLKHGCPTEEDEEWVIWFKTTDAYKDFYVFFEKQEEEYQRNESLRQVNTSH